MLQWLPSPPNKLMIYYSYKEGRFISVIRDAHSGEVVRVLPSPIYTVSHKGQSALTLNFARVARTRPGYGYVGVPDAWAEEKVPERDGIYWMNLVADDDLVSHFDWCDPTHILAWARKKGVADHYILFTDLSEEYQVIGRNILTQDGHCSYSPDRRWILTGTYPDREHKRRLLLYRPESERLVEVGGYYSPPELRGEIRCDLHPRWSRDGRLVCIDSAHEGQRQMYIKDVADIVGG